MVADRHQRSGADLGAQRAGGVGGQQRAGAGRLQRADRDAHAGGVAALVDVATPLEDRDRQAGERAERQRPGVAGHARLREARQVAVRDRHRVLERVGHGAETRAEDDPERRLEAGSALADDVDGGHARQELRPERERQQLAERRRAALSRRRAEVDRRVERHELAQALAAAAAGDAQRVGAGDHRRLDDPAPRRRPPSPRWPTPRRTAPAGRRRSRRSRPHGSSRRRRAARRRPCSASTARAPAP